ncbi:CK1 family protein kinase [Tritrichomonas foetus]|uniref:non-specific serine/threonine protein kinase n=1 Tax=Tritrichomonas foetus TaxID=1144522 RepID=A0A1J4K6I3_9EUKA|nr:CK1 family protein kinase [Tritrichomonas foetus]|eukprot:OHT06496.1 CK1 family protein kinase [Tritrichomonas foetus]
MMYGPQHIYINAKKRRVHKRDKRKLLEEGFKIDKYEVEACVGRGGFGDIYGVKVADSNKILALKLEPVEGKSNLLKEIEFLKRLQDSLNFPIYYDDGVTDQYRYLVMELLGPSLSSTRREMKHCHFSLSTTLRIGIKMLRCLEQVHKHGIIHCDVKPGNFLLRPDCLHSLVLVDFGLAQFYIHHKTGKHKKFKIYNGFNGTMKYASLNSMNESSLSRRDDLYSWFYMK